MARKVFFSAAHRYVSKHLTDEQNKDVFGACYNPYGHGHDYTLEAFFEGTIDPVSGLIVNLSDVDMVLKKIVAPLDHRHLNHEIPYFQDVVPTTENLAAYLFHLIEQECQGMPLRLVKVRLFENADLWVDYGSDRSLGI
jgi:6-pyruvoyltetrahydropterin/6-carboxytetrahydropterin synthase